MNVVTAVAQTNGSSVKYPFGAAPKLEPLVRQADLHLVSLLLPYTPFKWRL